MRAGTKNVGVNAGTIRRICAEVRADRRRRPKSLMGFLAEVKDATLELSDRVYHNFDAEGILSAAVELAASVIRLIEEGDPSIRPGAQTPSALRAFGRSVPPPSPIKGLVDDDRLRRSPGPSNVDPDLPGPATKPSG